MQNIPSSGGGQYRRPEYHNSTGNIYRSSHINSNNNNRRNETHHLLASRERNRNRNGHSYNYESKDREKYSNKEREKYSNKERERYQYQSRNSSSTHLQDKTNYRTNNYQISGVSHYSSPVKDIYSVPQKPREKERGSSGRTTYSTYSSVPHKIIYDTPSASPAIGSSSEPFTKFRTRIVINSES